MSGSMSHGEVRDLARNLIERGFYVFPTLHKERDPNDKKPAGGNGFHDATTDPDDFEKMLPKRLGPGWHLGLGIHPGASGHIVLDPDVKDGGKGLESLAWVESVYGELPGRRVRTPSGGLHVWMKLPDGYSGEIGNKKAWPDIDTRCHNGYVIAPGVFVPWGSWAPESGSIGQIPASVLAELESAHSEPKKIPTEATPGDRHESLVSIAAAYWAKGLNRDAVLHGIRGYNAAQCKPPKPDAELVGIVDWVVQQDGGPEPKYELKLPGESAESPFIDWRSFWSKDRTDPEWLFEDVLARGRGHALYAPAGAKKSLFTLWMVAKLATGRHRVVVVYLDYEMTEDDLYERLEDMGYGATTNLDRLRYALLPMLPPLDTKEGAAAVEEMLDTVQADYPEHHVLVVIDTTGRAVEGEENSADTFRRFYSATGIALKRRGVTWCRLDHTGKDISKGQRGSKGKDDDPDVVWELRETENGIMLTVKKRRMGWVPKRSAFAQSADPLRFTPIAGDWPKGTEETADLLDGLAVPSDASTRAAQTALKEAGEGRRRELVVAAQKWRNHPGNHPQIRIPEPPSEPPDKNPMSTRAEPLPEPPGTTSRGIPGTGSPPIRGTVTEAELDYAAETDRIAP